MLALTIDPKRYRSDFVADQRRYQSFGYVVELKVLDERISE